MKKSEAIRVYRLIDQWTIAELKARLGTFEDLEYIDYYMLMIKKRDELRKLLYGTSNLAELAEHFRIIKRKLKRKKKKKKRRLL